MYAENLKKIRKELGLTVAKLSEKIGVPTNTISAYERNLRCPSLDFGVQLYEKLDINLNWFATGKGDMFNPPQYENVADDILNEVRELLEKKGIR